MVLYNLRRNDCLWHRVNTSFWICQRRLDSVNTTTRFCDVYFERVPGLSIFKSAKFLWRMSDVKFIVTALAWEVTLPCSEETGNFLQTRVFMIIYLFLGIIIVEAFPTGNEFIVLFGVLHHKNCMGACFNIIEYYYARLLQYVETLDFDASRIFGVLSLTVF